MLYQELQQRYGNHVALRITRELSRVEFAKIDIDRLSEYLETRAEKAALCYKSLMENPLERGKTQCEILHRQWREAEDLSYLITVSDDVCMAARAQLHS